MKFDKSNLNIFLFFKLPSAWFTGVRVTAITENICEVRVKHRWISQNPFNSLYFAVQAMAAELTTGVIVMRAIARSGKKISMLVAQNKSEFTKKARGKITFKCTDIELVNKAIRDTIETGEGQTFWMSSDGVDQQGDLVSKFSFEWTIKVKS